MKMSMQTANTVIETIKNNISSSGLSIYDNIKPGDPKLWITTPILEQILFKELVNVSLVGLPLRTRSKFVKCHVCSALGYPTPNIFKKTQPRFFGQLLDIYIQKSNNLQVWNEELDPLRRYAIIQVSAEDIIINVKVVDGATLALLDTTGTLTQKYQATLKTGDHITELISTQDNKNILPIVTGRYELLSNFSPTDAPTTETLLPIAVIYEKISELVGETFRYVGSDQERNRGAELHKLISAKLGYQNHADDGRFPDIRNQLLEIKLQTSPTIDLGLVKPNSIEPLGVSDINGIKIRHCDIRYALFYATLFGDKIKLTHFFLTTGEDFFTRFPQFQGRVLNKKIQIPLPRNFFF